MNSGSSSSALKSGTGRRSGVTLFELNNAASVSPLPVGECDSSCGAGHGGGTRVSNRAITSEGLRPVARAVHS